MSDIHILEGTCKEQVGAIDCGSYVLVFHIPIDTPNADLTYPDFVSIIPNIRSIELDAIKAGTLLEIAETWNYNSNSTSMYYKNQIKDRWNDLYIKENAKYNFRVKFYLLEFAHI